jgi:prepilin-type N-terminal cleavage/methylation domain-containing protein
MMKPQKDGFTLIEMLVVIVVVGILVALAVPAATNLMKSGGLSGAAREVSNTLGLARQYAITHRTTTCVVFPFSGPGADVAPLYQSYAVYDLGSANYISKWEHLPLGVVFMNVNGSVGNPPCLDNLGSVNSIHYPYANSGATPWLACIQFKPWGTASSSGTFTITEGLMNGVVPQPTSISAGALANVVTVSVDNVVGRIKVTRP